MSDPFLLPRPCVISFSGGRTSGMLLKRVVDAFGGSLPDDVVAVFCNTGKECAETLDFVDECSRRWNVNVRWLEYRWERGAGKARGGNANAGRHYCVEVDHRTASREGEPFRMVIEARGFLPNPVMRFCTAELKIRTTNRFVRQILGWQSYHNAIGLRACEPKRVAKLMARRRVVVEPTLFGDEEHVERGASHPPGEMPLCPLADAGVRNEDVLIFWERQAFDLGLPADPRTGRTLDGNCDRCFLKSTRSLLDGIRRTPESADWWIETETLIKGRDRVESERFRHDRAPYEELKRVALGLVPMPLLTEADYEGLACGEHAECNCTD